MVGNVAGWYWSVWHRLNGSLSRRFAQEWAGDKEEVVVRAHPRTSPLDKVLSFVESESQIG
jgi:hypothetical protein